MGQTADSENAGPALFTHIFSESRRHRLCAASVGVSTQRFAASCPVKFISKKTPTRRHRTIDAR
jgi:hypothetical protein